MPFTSMLKNDLGQYGVPKKWYFMFQSSYWCPQRVGGNANTSNGKQDVESIDSGMNT